MKLIDFFKRAQISLIDKKRELLRNISSDFFGPEMIRIYPTGYLCNNSCLMCWRSNNLNYRNKNKLIILEKKSLKISEYQKIFQTFPPGMQTVEIVGGGEPLIFREIDSLTTMIKNNFYSGSLITNGILLNHKRIEHLLKINFDRIRISLHADNQLTYKLINGTDNFDKVWENISIFLDKRRKIQNKKLSSLLGLLFVIQRQNYKNIYNFALLAQKRGCDYIEFDTIYPYSRSMRLNEEEILKTVIQLSKVAKYLLIKNNATDIINLYKNHPHVKKERFESKNYYRNKKCFIPTSSMILDSIGHVHPCCFLDNSELENVDCGDFRQTGSIWAIWRQKKYKEIRKNLRSGQFYETCTKFCNYAFDEKFK